jgi:hypothetical protein
MNKEYESLEVILIEWQDAASTDDWHSRKKSDPSLATIYSVGIKIEETKNIITLALNLDTDNDHISCRMDIPKSCITRRRKLCLLKDLKTAKRTTRSK